MDAEESPGHRLKAYIRARHGRKDGGDMALARTAGVRRQTLQEWYSGSSVPRLAELAEVARALGVRRVDLVAAYDGVTAPDTQKEAAPVTGRLDEIERKLDQVLERQSSVADEAIVSLTRILSTGESQQIRVMRQALADALAETSHGALPGDEPASPSGTDAGVPASKQPHRP